MANLYSQKIWPGNMWLPDPDLSLEERYRQVLEMAVLINNTPCGMLKCKNDDSFTILHINDGFLNLTGYTREEISSLFANAYLNLIHPDDRKRVHEPAIPQGKNGSILSSEYRILCKNGACRWIAETRCCAQEEDGQALFFTLTDITDLCETREDLRLSLDWHHMVMQQSQNVIFEWEKNTNSLLFSANWMEIFGYPPMDILDFHQMKKRGHLKPKDVDVLRQMLDEMIRGTPFLSQECQIRTKSGAFSWFRIQAACRQGTDGGPLKIVGMIVNIDEEKRMIDSLRKKAERDPLTNLYNKAAIQHLVEQYLAAHPDDQCALLMIDIDNFKFANDTMGHLFGDVLLTDLSASICGETRVSDLVGRVGGDEFLVLLKGVSSPQAAFQKSLRFLALAQKLFQEKHHISISCSIGISLFPADGRDFRSLYQCADIALYQAKRKGKNTSCLYSSQMTCPLPDSPGPKPPVHSRRLSAAGIRQLMEDVFLTLYQAKDIEKTIPLILETIGSQLGASRAYVFENSEDGSFCSNTFEWCNNGISPQRENLQNLSYGSLSCYGEQFDKNGVFFCQNAENALSFRQKQPPAQKIYSMMQCMMRCNGEFSGFVGFDECTGNRLWTEEEVTALTRLSELIGIFLSKKRAQQRANRNLRRMQDLLDRQNASLYAVSQKDFRLLYLNKKMKQQYPFAAAGHCCYGAFFQRNAPCEGCPARNEEGYLEIFNPRLGIWSAVSASTIEWDGLDAVLLTCYDITKYRKDI